MSEPGRNTGQEGHQSDKSNNAGIFPVCTLKMFYEYFCHATVCMTHKAPLLKKYERLLDGCHVFR